MNSSCATILFILLVINNLCNHNVYSFKQLNINSCKQICYNKVINRQFKTVIKSTTTNEFVVDEEALIKRINEEIYAQNGVELEDLINPSKVVNLERDILQLENDLTLTSNQAEITKINNKIEDKRSKVAIEKRAVMRGWLKNLFLFQSFLAIGVSLVMVYDVYPGEHLPLSIKVLGFWMWWLFIIPSLRARKPSAAEKEALNIAFLLSPLASVAMPVITRDVVTIWWVNAVVVALCYVYAFVLKSDYNSDNLDENKTSLPPLIVKAIKALDYGSGQERGQRK